MSRVIRRREDNTMIVDKEYCMSSFLLYRRVVDRNKGFAEGLLPKTVPETWNKKKIYDSFQLENHLRERVKEATCDGKTALALSGGIDSAILAKMMPKGSTAYTFRCIADDHNTVDETPRAKFYADTCGLKHNVIDITWDDMTSITPTLIKHKNAPLHSIEIQIFKAGVQAKKDGFDRIIYGETADVNYGGLSNVLSKEWSVGEFIERYAYLKPWYVLKQPKVDFSCVLPYCRSDGTVDVHKYLSRFDIIESINSYINACETAEIEFVAPFADTCLGSQLDLDVIRCGRNKYLIRDIFERLYKDVVIPDKIPMPRATDQWLMKWNGPKRYEFIPNCVNGLTGDQKWLVWCLEECLNVLNIE